MGKQRLFLAAELVSVLFEGSCYIETLKKKRQFGVYHCTCVLVYTTRHFSECLLWTSPVKQPIAAQIFSISGFTRETKALQSQTILPNLVSFAFKNFIVTDYTLWMQLIKSMTLS